eukprot:561391-Pelagomonas_calceolata.AAC.2
MLQVPFGTRFKACQLRQPLSGYTKSKPTLVVTPSLQPSGACMQAEEDDLLIYNWHAEYTGRQSYDGEEAAFEQAYFFPPASATSGSSSSESSEQ